MNFRIAPAELIERAKQPADTDDFIAWFMSQRQDNQTNRTEHQRCKSEAGHD